MIENMMSSTLIIAIGRILSHKPFPLESSCSLSMGDEVKIFKDRIINRCICKYEKKQKHPDFIGFGHFGLYDDIVQ